MPSPKTVTEIKKNLLQPALTSHYEVTVGLPNGFAKVMNEAFGYSAISGHQEQLHLLCSEASLPGSQLATTEINNDFTGVTERHAYRRIFDDRLDLTFYVDVENYLPIRTFETWIAYITGEQYGSGYNQKNPDDPYSPNYFYRMRYPDGDKGYTASGLSVTKFEKNYAQHLRYEFIKSWPISITSMPVSYNGSDLLRCTVSMTYIRYVVEGITGVQTPLNTAVTIDPGGQAQAIVDAQAIADANKSMNTQIQVDMDNEMYGDTMPEGSFNITGQGANRDPNRHSTSNNKNSGNNTKKIPRWYNLGGLL